MTYRLRIHVKEVDRIADNLDAIADAKQATLTHIEWDYAGASVEELLADCATRALGKAKRLATALGVTLDGVHEVHEEQLDDHGRPQPMAAHAPMMAVRAKRTVASELAGLELAPTKKLGARVRIAYRIGSNLR